MTTPTHAARDAAEKKHQHFPEKDCDACLAAEAYVADRASRFEAHLHASSMNCSLARESFLVGHDYGYARGQADMIAALRSELAAHSTLEKGEIRDYRPNHIGPSLMSGALWANWLERKFSREGAK